MNDLDLIIPCYNEETVLPHLFDELTKIFSSENFKKHKISKVHYIFINDGSKDRTSELVQKFLSLNNNGTLINLSRNFGHQPAVTAGFEHSKSSMIGVIDADLQDPPQIILNMVDKMREGYDVVYGVRRKRKENFIKVFCYWFYYRLLSYLAEFDIAKDSGDFALYSRRIVDEMNKLPEKIRYHRGLRTWVGFPQVGYEYERMARFAGESKYTFKQLYTLATNGITSLSTRPLRVIQFFSLLFSGLSTLSTSFLLYFLTGQRTKVEVLLVIVCILVLTTTAFLMFSLYIMSAYIGRGYVETKLRPVYIAKEALNFHETN